MILTSIDAVQTAPTPETSGPGVPHDLKSDRSDASFRSILDVPEGHANKDWGEGKPKPWKRLLDRLTNVMQSLEGAGLSEGAYEGIGAAVTEIAAALADFEEATGTGFLEKIEQSYSVLTGNSKRLEELKAFGDENAAAPALIALIERLTKAAIAAISTAKAVGSQPEQSLGLSTIANLQIRSGAEQETPLIEASEQPSQAIVRAHSLIATQQIGAAKAVGMLQAKGPGQTTSPAGALKQPTQIGSAPESEQLDLQIAIASSRPEPARGQPGNKIFKSAFELVASIASGQAVSLDTNATGSALENLRFADVMAQDQSALASATLADKAAAASSGSVETSSAKPSRFATIIIDQIRSAHISGGQTKIELHPRGLGAIEIELSTDIDGATNVIIRSDNYQVLNALREMREPWAQIPGIESGSSFSFEDLPNQSEQDERRHSANVGNEAGTRDYDAGDIAASEGKVIIEGDQLDLTA